MRPNSSEFNRNAPPEKTEEGVGRNDPEYGVFQLPEAFRHSYRIHWGTIGLYWKDFAFIGKFYIF
jgi:hypothetical protein